MKRNAVFTPIITISKSYNVAMLCIIRIRFADAVSTKVSKYVKLYFENLILGHQACLFLVNGSISIKTRMEDNTAGNNLLLLILKISTGDRSNIFCDIKEFLSFSNAKVYFSGFCDFSTLDIDFGIKD